VRLKKKLTWAYIKNNYIEDYLSGDDGPIYSWDNFRDDGIRVLVKLERLYLFSNFVQKPSSHIMHFKILGDSPFLNHHRVSLLIDLSTSPLGGSSWKVNARFLQEAKGSIKVVWEVPLVLLCYDPQNETSKSAIKDL
jgi:hypothetical protein